MVFRSRVPALALLLSGALALLTCLPAKAEAPFRLGVQTHFEQGWPIDLIDKAKALGATLLRDEVAWSRAETSPGQYDFSVADLYLSPINAAGMQLQLVSMDGNPLYDDGMTPHSEVGRRAYARYLAALTQHSQGTIIQIELGNEVNSGEFLRGPYTAAPARFLAAQAKALRAELRPEDQMICAGTNTVAIGFLREFFRYGGLEACDAISVHPYRDNPETLDLELTRLREVMREMGGEKPIHATEFGKWVEDPVEAGPWMLKMVAVLSAAGVKDAIWYALVDEPYWPNMGLLAPDGSEKPAAATFRLLQEKLLPLGRAVDLSPSRSLRIYGFGPTAYVVWGAGPLQISGAELVLDTSGQTIEPPKEASEQPVIVLGSDASIETSVSPAIYSSLYHFGTAPFSYFARRPGLGLTPLELIDDRWTSYRSAPDLAPLRITDDWLTTARFADGAFGVVERFTAPVPGMYRISGWWETAPKSEPATLAISRAGIELVKTALSASRYSLPPFEVTLNAGDRIEFELIPNGAEGNGSTRRRFQIIGPLPVPGSQ